MEPEHNVRKLPLSNQQIQPNTFYFKIEYLSKVIVTGIIGAKVNVHIDVFTKAVHFNKFFETALELAQSFNKKEQLLLYYQKYNQSQGFGFLFGLFGILGGDGYQQGSQRTSYEVNQNSNHESLKLANIISSLTETTIRVAGDIWVEGISQIPSEAHVFVETMTIKGRDQDGKIVYLKVINHDGVYVRDKQGNIIESDDLEIIPL